MARENVGKLSHRIKVFSPTETADSTGQPILTYADLPTRTIWGKYEGTSGREVMTGEQTMAVIAGMVTVRRGMELTEKMKLVINGRGISDLTVHIVAVLPPEPDNDRQAVLVAQPGA